MSVYSKVNFRPVYMKLLLRRLRLIVLFPYRKLYLTHGFLVSCLTIKIYVFHISMRATCLALFNLLYLPTLLISGEENIF